MKLNELQPKKNSTGTRMRVGRGIGSGKGKTCGRGQKGQKARSGVSLKGFEGGQMPLYRRLPKRGFTNIFSNDYSELNIGKLQIAIDTKKIDPKKMIDEDILVKAGVVRRKKDGIRLLGQGILKAKVDLKLSGGATKTAAEAVKKAGGKLEIIKAKSPAPAKKEEKATKAKK